jgi:hypothetical protein
MSEKHGLSRGQFRLNGALHSKVGIRGRKGNPIGAANFAFLAIAIALQRDPAFGSVGQGDGGFQGKGQVAP